MKRALLFTVAALALCSFASAYQQIVQGGFAVSWASRQATIYYDAATISGAYVNEYRSGMQVWTDVSGSDFRFIDGGASTSTNVQDTTNGVTDVYFGGVGGSGAYAVTYVMNTGSGLTECDMAFNSQLTWSTAGANSPGGLPDFRTVAIHEYGHALGLGHETAVSSVMNSGDPGISQHTLFADDVAGIRFIYPAPTPPSPPPPPPGQEPDLELAAVTYRPTDAQAGDEIDVTFVVTNSGQGASGAFNVDLVLTRKPLPSAADAYLGSVFLASLDPGESVSRTTQARLPLNLDPVPYRVGAVADGDERTADSDRSNNSAVASGLIFGGGELDPLVPGESFSGTLLPLGQKSFVLDLYEGMRIKMRAKLAAGSVELSFLELGRAQPLAEIRRYRKATQRFTVPADGRYVLRIASHAAVVSKYEVSISARPLVRTGNVLIEDDTHMSLPGYEGSRLDLRVKSRSDVRPTLTLVGVDATVKTNRRGKLVRVKPVTLEDTGPVDLRLSAGESPTGNASYRFRLRFPNPDKRR